MPARMRQQLRRLRRYLNAFGFAFHRWEARLAARRRVNATVRALSVLDDRTLHDLGLDRSEVISAALDSERTAGDHTLRRGRGRSPAARGFQCMEQ